VSGEGQTYEVRSTQYGVGGTKGAEEFAEVSVVGKQRCTRCVRRGERQPPDTSDNRTDVSFVRHSLTYFFFWENIQGTGPLGSV
jgi:hypothetical protein